MGKEMKLVNKRNISPFNGPLEIGLRTITILCEAYPESYSLQRLIIYDYLVVHSDDIEDGPKGLHPQTPHRSGELLIRRDSLQKGLHLYMSRNLVRRHFQKDTGIFYSATEYTGNFLDSLNAGYTIELRERSKWLIHQFSRMGDNDLEDYINSNLDKWGAEFETESVLWLEDL